MALYFVFMNFVFFILFFLKKEVFSAVKSAKGSITDVSFDYTNIMQVQVQVMDNRY